LGSDGLTDGEGTDGSSVGRVGTGVSLSKGRGGSVGLGVKSGRVGCVGLTVGERAVGVAKRSGMITQVR
jgi:hypothetical protein